MKFQLATNHLQLKTKYLLLLLLVITSQFTLKAQSITLSDLGLSLSRGNTVGDSITMSANCKINAPLEGTKIVLLAGTDKDKSEATMVSGGFVQANGRWQLLPASFYFREGTVIIPFKISTGNSSQLKYLTVYVTDATGKVVSNKLYYQMP